jgi:hypothetical protein
MPNGAHTRQDYLNALADEGCTVPEIHDIAVGGEPYGNLSDEAMEGKRHAPTLPGGVCAEGLGASSRMAVSSSLRP